ncbi:Hypothetical predicted protein [Xyrichtys novacula]|uniref:Uncharacterized protein n=1 Tax=Xyrichtys novacula TaxID=13765 RepID=A0AAV1ENH4_XYRNO|nr:Hypothetical predicted protein [Xyrichtys novacula]
MKDKEAKMYRSTQQQSEDDKDGVTPESMKSDRPGRHRLCHRSSLVSELRDSLAPSVGTSPLLFSHRISGVGTFPRMHRAGKGHQSVSELKHLTSRFRAAAGRDGGGVSCSIRRTQVANLSAVQ